MTVIKNLDPITDMIENTSDRDFCILMIMLGSGQHEQN